MIDSINRTLNQWLIGVRFYIALGIVAVTLETWWWASMTYSGSDLFAIRLEEIYGWLSLGLITLAVSIGPVYKILPKFPGKLIMFDARRLIGVGGAWFASLHVAIAYISLFSAANPLTLPTIYQQAFALGTVALIILLAMAFTSFDKALKKMGVWWFRLHRLVYIALLAILAHSFMIGVHATTRQVMALLAFAATALLVMNIFSQRRKPSVYKLVSITSAAVLLVIIFSYGITQAHVLKQDNAISGVLHMPPSDDPTAGEPTKIGIIFADKTGGFSLQGCDCKIRLEQKGKLLETVIPEPALAGATVSSISTLTFPRIGVYDLIATGNSKDDTFQNFKLSYEVRVASGTGDAAASTPVKSNSEGNTTMLIIAAGSFAILAMVAFVAIDQGGRYKVTAHPDRLS